MLFADTSLTVSKLSSDLGSTNFKDGGMLCISTSCGTREHASSKNSKSFAAQDLIDHRRGDLLRFRACMRLGDMREKLPVLALWLGFGLDALLGEAKRWHPLVGIGRLARAVENWLHPDLEEELDPAGSRDAGFSLRLERLGKGALACGVVLGPVLGAAWGWMVATHACGSVVGMVADALLLYLCLGHRSLNEHAIAVTEPLLSKDLVTARKKLSYIVSRDTHALQESEIAKGVLESVLENGSDAVIASLFWFTVFGPLGAVAHRVINTLDAMWGYRSPRYQDFGTASARLDDLVNWIPARICALGYALFGDTRSAILCWLTQAKRHDSPNAGPVMAAGAGALGLVLGGNTQYQGRLRQRPVLGCGRVPQASDIERALKLLRRCTIAVLCLFWMLRSWWGN